MNAKTANRLNALLYEAKPIPRPLPDDYEIPLKDLTRPLVLAAMQQAQREEIIAAAKQKRQAWADELCDPNCGYQNISRFSDSVARRAYLIALPAIQAVIEADNARRVAKYEAYRVACEQGVAVPPAE
jgi:hypothetical protein